ncbi:MAG: hypothetical protein ACHQII_03485 [Bacteroidia bacterium]
MQKINVLILAVLAAACSTHVKDKTGAEMESASTVTITPTIHTAARGMVNYKDSILGNWTDGSSDDATIMVLGDSICYISHLDKYKYQIQNDSIKIFFTDKTFAGKMRLKGDTLFWFSKTDTTKLWKFL